MNAFQKIFIVASRPLQLRCGEHVTQILKENDDRKVQQDTTVDVGDKHKDNDKQNKISKEKYNPLAVGNWYKII